MPKTKFQDLTFTVIMVLIFVYVMTFYNAGMENGVTFSTFGYALKNMWVEVIGAFIAQRDIASKIVKKLVARIFDKNDKPVFKLLATAGFTVSLMAPIMTFSYYKSRKKSILLIEKLRKYKMYIMMYELDRIT